MAITKSKVTPVRVAAPKQPKVPELYREEELVTVLHGFGRVPAKAVSWLDEYRVQGGVIRDVPYGVAKQWKTGARDEGRKTARPMPITILPRDAPEADFARAAGVSEEDSIRMSVFMAATDADSLLDKLPKEKLNLLRIALDRRLNQK